ncbi:hypothetical protein FACS189499_06650 [Clostridia bacterium]|nr:hypothetical protein FACS189499_06650 [Clostridia bacterium]
MNIIVSNVLTIEDPTAEVRAWCKNNLIIANPDYDKKARMHLWRGDTPRTLCLYEEKGSSLILPFGTLRDLSRLKLDTTCRKEFAVAEDIGYGEDVPLYDYQIIAVEEMLNAHYGILQSPAGSGKTQCGIALIKKFGKRALWLTHTLDLLKQSKSRAEQYMSEGLIGTITEGKVSIGKGVTFATVQTMCKLDLPRYKDYWDVVIVDECHRVAGSPTSVTRFSKVLNALSARHKIGLSATVHRSDGLIAATYTLIGDVAYTVPDEAVKDSTMRVGIKPISTGVQSSRECINTERSIT